METSPHLFDPPRYTAEAGRWHDGFGDAVSEAPQALTWDVAGILGVLSLGYTTGERTLLKEVREQPWLSEITPGGEPRLKPIPPHDTLDLPAKVIAEKLFHLLREEVLHACRGRERIYILLSGGLDSRIVAGVIARTLAAGELSAQCVAVTWGMPDSRDVVYGRLTAKAEVGNLAQVYDGDLEEWYFLSARVKSTGEIGTWVTPGFRREILDPRQVTRYDINNYVHLTTPADPLAKALNTTGLFDQRIDYPTGDLMNIDGAQASRACVTDAHN